MCPRPGTLFRSLLPVFALLFAKLLDQSEETFLPAFRTSVRTLSPVALLVVALGFVARFALDFLAWFHVQSRYGSSAARPILSDSNAPCVFPFDALQLIPFQVPAVLALALQPLSVLEVALPLLAFLEFALPARVFRVVANALFVLALRALAFLTLPVRCVAWWVAPLPRRGRATIVDVLV
ncbi:MAG: hypothetical protein CMJ89_01865, partial [Planctomycetes bacterium]|nr:hypothetical protein [Planctomycetota bacterium]